MGFNIGGFLKGLMGSGSEDSPTAESGEAVEYKGFIIRPAPQRQGGQWLTAGIISKEFEDGVKEHEFVRADTYSSRDDAEECAVMKAKRIVDEQGDRMFEQR